MHELALARDILRKIEVEAAARGFKKVSYGRVRIGETLLSDQTELEEMFIAVSKGTIAEGMNLDITISPVKAFCRNCKKEFRTGELRLDCPECGLADVEISQGKELIIERLEE